MFKKIMLAVLMTLGSLYADMTGGEVSLGIFSHTPSGSASYAAPIIGVGTSADLEETFGWENNNDLMFKAYIEHPLPFIPNFKIGYSKLTHEGSGSPTDFTWGNDFIGFSGDLESTLHMGVTDLSAYYEVLDTDLELDLGITIRYIFGDILLSEIATAKIPVGSISASPASETVSFSALAPMLYGKARFVVPGTDISLQLEANGISYDETTFYDYELGIRYTLSFGLGIECGYKALYLDSTALEDGLSMDLEMNGFYASAVWDF